MRSLSLQITSILIEPFICIYIETDLMKIVPIIDKKYLHALIKRILRQIFEYKIFSTKLLCDLIYKNCHRFIAVLFFEFKGKLY